MLKTLQLEKLNFKVPDSTFSKDCYLAWDFLSDLAQYYPKFKYWFFSKVCSDIAIGKRKIILKKSGYQVIAVAILKKSYEENKICTFRVSKTEQGNGIGTELMQESLEWLGCVQPLITVNEENAPEFEYFLKNFNFQKTHESLDLYRSGKKEIIYNAPKIISPY
jgi:GNAT superfamily N-acetyltransferase